MAEPEKKPPFDPSQPFTVVDDSKPPFDPNQPYTVPADSLAEGPAEPAPLPLGIPGAQYPSPMQAVAQTSPEQRAHRARLLAEIGVPMAAGLLLGPEAGPPARAGVAALEPLLMRMGWMGLAGGTGAELGNVFEPPATPEEGHARVRDAAVANAAGEPIIGGLGMAAGSAARGLRTFAENRGIRALGFLPSILRRMGGGEGVDFMDRAREASGRALDEGVLTSLASSETMARRAIGTAKQAGEELGQLRQKIDQLSPGVPVADVVSMLDTELRGAPEWWTGMSDAPAYEANLAKALKDVTSRANNGTTQLNMEDLAALKKLFAKRTEFHANPQVNESLGGAMADQSGRAHTVVRAFEEGHAGVNLTPEEFEDFKKQKELYSLMQELINPEYGSLISRTAKDAGNEGSLIPAIAASGSSDLPTAIGALIATRTLQQRGSQLAASGANNLRNLLLSPAMRHALAAGVRFSAANAGRRGDPGLGIAP